MYNPGTNQSLLEPSQAKYFHQCNERGLKISSYLLKTFLWSLHCVWESITSRLQGWDEIFPCHCFSFQAQKGAG